MSITNLAMPGVPWFEKYYTLTESACTSASACTGQVPIALPPGSYTWWVRAGIKR